MNTFCMPAQARLFSQEQQMLLKGLALTFAQVRRSEQIAPRRWNARQKKNHKNHRIQLKAGKKRITTAAYKCLQALTCVYQKHK